MDIVIEIRNGQVFDAYAIEEGEMWIVDHDARRFLRQRVIRSPEEAARQVEVMERETYEQ